MWKIVIALLMAFAIVSSFTASQLEELKVKLWKDGKIGATGKMYDLELRIAMPSNTSYQKIQYTSQLFTDEYGNFYAYLKKTEPENPYQYNFSCTADLYERISQNITEGSFEQENGNWSKLYNSLTENSSSLFEGISEIAFWVNHQIEYDLDMVGIEMTPEEILSAKKGVCIHYTTLFNKIVNSSGIKTRELSGYVYTHDWIPHSWSEVYLGGWIPVDATWMQFGRLDAGHIEFNKIDDKTKIIASVKSGVDLYREGGNDQAIGVEVINYKENDNLFSANTPFSSVPFDSEGIIYAEFTGMDYRAFSAKALPCKGEALVFEKEEQLAILIPNKKTIVVWKFKVNPSLERGYKYTCPVKIAASGFGDKILIVEISEAGIEKAEGSLSKNFLKEGEIGKLYYKGKYLFAASPTFSANLPYTLGEGEYTFRASGRGQQFLYVVGRGSVNELMFNVVPEKRISLISLGIMNKTFEGENVVEICFENNVGAKVKISQDSYSREKMFYDFGKKCANFTLLLEKGEKEVSILVEGGGEKIFEKQSVLVLKKPVISMDYYELGTKEANIVVALKVDGEITEPAVELDGKKQDLYLDGSAQEVPFTLDVGTHVMKFSYKDALGHSHTIEKEISVSGNPTRNVPSSKSSFSLGRFWEYIIKIFFK